MATTFVRVTDPDTLFELWVGQLLYNKYDGTDNSLNFCKYEAFDNESIEEARAHYLPFWRNGEGIEPDDIYGYLQED